MNATAPIPPKVRLLVAMLGSDIDTEALAAARAIKRTLQGVGLDMHALAASIVTVPAANDAPALAFRRDPSTGCRPRGPAPVFSKEQTAAYRRMAQYCRDNDRGQLCGGERKFICIIASGRGEMSFFQVEWLEDISARFGFKDRRT